MSLHLSKFLYFSLCLLVMTGCSSQHFLVKKAHMEAADQCLLAQQDRHTQTDEQQRQLAETLELLRQTLELQREGDSVLREFMRTATADLDQEKSDRACDPGQGSVPLTSASLDKAVVGATEKVLLTDLGIILPARMDTGANTSSVDARNIESFERNGEDWVRFDIYDPDLDQLVELERPRSRKVLITQSNSEEPERRPVIEMRITLGSMTQVAEFTLANRNHLEQPLLIGRNVLRDLMLVDVAKDNVTEPNPPKASDNGREEDE